MGLPPSEDGALQLIVSPPRLNFFTDRFLGAPGVIAGATGVIPADAFEVVPVPTAFIAVTLKK
jgi:hypothetical protein